MAPDVLARIGSEIIASEHVASSTLVLWHAGEPLSLGVSWFEAAHEILRRPNSKPLRFQFQTNGVLVNSAWAAFFAGTGSSVGLSLDGPAYIHDAKRKYRSGAGSFDDAIRAVDVLRGAGVEFTNIATVTESSLDHADEIFDFFYKLRPARVGFSIEEAEGQNATSSLYKPRMVAKVEAFFKRIAQLNFDSKRPLKIREIDNVINALLPTANRNCVSQETQLGSIVSVDVNGKAAFFSPEMLTTRSSANRGAVGNLMEESFQSLLLKSETRELRFEIEDGVRRCRTECDYFRFCGGGSPANKMMEHGRFDVTETWYCKLARQAVTRGILDAVRSATTVRRDAYFAEPLG